MSDLDVVNKAITSAFNALPVKMAGMQARLMLLAINLQEDPQQLRQQVGGPAKSLWQGEQGGGLCTGVFMHSATKRDAGNLATLRDVACDPHSIYLAIEKDDVLAAGLARLLLWSDPKPLPKLGAVREAFDLYVSTWRPGAYHNGSEGKRQSLWRKWQGNYAKAMDYLSTLGSNA